MVRGLPLRRPGSGSLPNGRCSCYLDFKLPGYCKTRQVGMQRSAVWQHCSFSLPLVSTVAAIERRRAIWANCLASLLPSLRDVRYNLARMNPAQPANRPRSVTLTLWGVFLLGVWNLGRALALGQQRDLLKELAAQPDPVFRLMMALVWGVIFLGLAEALRRRRPFTRRLIPVLIGLHALYEIGLILFFTTTIARETLILDIVLAGGGVAFTAWALLRTAVSHYFIAQEPS